jgi:hypothetical protein
MGCPAKSLTPNQPPNFDAVKLSDRLFSVEDIVALIDARAGPPKKRGPYKPRRPKKEFRLARTQATGTEAVGCGHGLGGPE